jgi:hypothetical protein
MALFHCRSGQAPMGTCARNKQLAKVLPSSNSPFSQSVYDFTKMLLKKVNPNAPWPDSPTCDQVLSFLSITNWQPLINSSDIFACFAHLSQPSELFGKKKSIPSYYQNIFLEDLNIVHIPHCSFNWKEKSNSPWNKAFFEMILKHWMYTKSQGAFSAYPIDLSNKDPSKLSGVLIQWFNGRRAQILAKKTSPADFALRTCQRNKVCCRKVVSISVLILAFYVHVLMLDALILFYEAIIPLHQDFEHPAY